MQGFVENTPGWSEGTGQEQWKVQATAFVQVSTGKADRSE